MSNVTAYWLIALLVALVLLSGFFSGSETGMTSLNRYRLRHMARKKHRAAARVVELMRRMDRLLGVILLGNTFANVVASSIATVIAAHYFGELGIAIASITLTIVILVFAEITPKTLAALHPEKVAFPASLPLKFLLKALYPMVWLLNSIGNGILRLFHVRVRHRGVDPLSHEELRAVVYESSGKISASHQDMLLGILDLDQITVEDIMVPRSEIVGIDVEDDWGLILEKLMGSQHTRLPVVRGGIENVIGILHLRNALNLLASKRLNKSTLLSVVKEPYFVPEGTSLNVQLLNFKQQKDRSGLVVDEYGDILGLVTLEDILEEIVGEFTTNLAENEPVFHLQKDGCYVVEGTVSVRDFNRGVGFSLPTDGPKTLSGMVIEHLQMIPKTQVSMCIADHRIEVVVIKDNMIKQLKVWPAVTVAKS